MDKIKILRCPFCGSEPLQETGENILADGSVEEFECVHCKECGACIEADTKEEAIAAWNNRKPIDLIVGNLEYEANEILRLGFMINPVPRGQKYGLERAIEIIKNFLL